MGVENICLADSPSAYFNNYNYVLKKTEIKDVCDKLKINILRIESYKPKIYGGIFASSIIDNFDLIINLPKLKTHSLMGLTLSVKNLYGLIPGTLKVSLHGKYPNNEILAEKLYRFSESISGKVVNILDGIVGMEGEGPSRGRPINTSMVLLGCDTIALDIVAARFLKLPINFCMTNKVAIKKGFDINNIEVHGDDCSFQRRIKKPISFSVNYIPDSIRKRVAKVIYVKPVIDNRKCTVCKSCLDACPVKAIEYIDKSVIINSKQCIECYCCYEICEFGAIYLKRSLLHRLFV